jgi:cyclopropane fatty-acyl-phospholipid synthase-like methyltransferase
LISKIHALLQAHYTDYFKKQFRALPRTEQMALFEIITSFQQQLQRESTVAVKGTLSDGIHRVIPLEGANWDYLVVDVQSVLNEDVLGSLIIFM